MDAISKTKQLTGSKTPQRINWLKKKQQKTEELKLGGVRDSLGLHCEGGRGLDFLVVDTAAGASVHRVATTRRCSACIRCRLGGAGRARRRTPRRIGQSAWGPATDILKTAHDATPRSPGLLAWTLLLAMDWQYNKGLSPSRST